MRILGFSCREIIGFGRLNRFCKIGMRLVIASAFLVSILPCEATPAFAVIDDDYVYVENDTLMNDISAADWSVWCKLQPSGYNCGNKGTKYRYYYDILLQDCTSRDVGDCKHNYNKFESMTECHTQCREEGQHKISMDLAPKVYCRLQPDFGNCNGYYPRFYYDVTDARCKGFSFSGCGGNLNRFVSFQMCSAICTPLVTYKSINQISEEVSAATDLSLMEEQDPAQNQGEPEPVTKLDLVELKPAKDPEPAKDTEIVVEVSGKTLVVNQPEENPPPTTEPATAAASTQAAPPT